MERGKNNLMLRKNIFRLTKIEKILLILLAIGVAIAVCGLMYPEKIVKREPFFPIVGTALKLLGIWFSIRFSIQLARYLNKSGNKKGAFFVTYIGWAIAACLCVYFGSEIAGDYWDKARFRSCIYFVVVCDFIIFTIKH